MIKLQAETEAGEGLPHGWQFRSIGEVTTRPPSYGINAAATPLRGSLPTYLRITDITDEGRLNQESRVGVSHANSDRYYLEPGDLVFARTGASTGKSYYYDGSDGHLVFAGFLLRASPNIDLIDPRFLSYAVKTRQFSNWLKEVSQRSGQPGINGAQLSAYRFAAPPLSEQRRIARTLHEIDDLITSLDALIAKKRDIKQAAMQQLIGGLVRLPGYSGEWSETSLRQVTSQRVTYGIVKAGEFQSNGVRMLRGGDISKGAIVGDPPFVTEAKSQEFARTILQENDVVVALVGYPGEAAVVPAWLVGGNISRAVGLIRPNSRLSSRYLSHYLNSPQGRKAFLRPSAGSAQIVVNLKDLDYLPLLLPSLKEQESISDAIDDMCADLLEHQRKRKKLGLLKEGMMQQLLTGRIRLA